MKKIQRHSRVNSTGNLKGFLISKKREREEEERTRKELEAELKQFQKSSKIQRSPPATKTEEKEKTEENPETMEEIKNMMITLNKNMIEMKDDFKKELTEMREEFKKEMKELMRQNQEKEEKWNKEKRDLSERIDKLEWRLEKEERMRKKNNVIIKGAGANNIEETDAINFLRNELKINISAAETLTIQNKERKIGILIKCTNWEEKNRIMKNRQALREKKVYIDNDLTFTEREVQKKIRERMEEEKAKGNTTKMGYMKIMINDTWLKWDERDGNYKNLTTKN